MKKLLVLLVVLAVASLVNAAEIGLNGDNTAGAGAVTLDVADIGEWLDGFLVIGIQGTGTLTSSLGADAPTDAEFVGTTVDFGLDGDLGAGDIYSMISYTSTYPAGTWIDASYSGAVAGDVMTAYASLDGESWTELGSITIIPEPATIALLCLGGLLIRKK